MADLQTAARVSSVMDDPGVKSIARVYAVALLDATPAAELPNLLEEAQSFVADVLDPNPAFERLLCTPATLLGAKLQFIEQVVSPRCSPLFTNFLRVLARHGRLDVVRAVVAALVHEQEVRSGKVRVQVRSATPLSDGARQAIAQRLAASLSAEPILEESVEAGLLGGLVIRVGDTVYDGSVKNRLKQLRAKLRERCLNEIQRGRDRFRHSEGN
jgi:F-type H+-transporting ATPase subunit delta